MKGKLWYTPLLSIALMMSTSAGLADRGGRDDNGHERGGRGGVQMVDVIVTYKAMPGQAETDRARGLGGEIRRAYGHLPMRVIRVPIHALDALARGKGVRFVTPDDPVEAFSPSARRTARLPGPDSSSFVPVDPNLGVAVLDSGIGSHSDIHVRNRVDCLDGATGGGCGVSGPAVFLDSFDTTSYSNSDGAADWSASPWIETGDNGSPSGGDITVEVDDCPDSGDRCIEFDNDAGIGASIERGIDLSGVDSATLVFDYRLDASYAEYVLEVSPDGGYPHPLPADGPVGLRPSLYRQCPGQRRYRQ